jgi:branched-chain amino acid transport system permease protein
LRTWLVLGGVLASAAALVAALGTPRLERTFIDYLLTALLVLALQMFVGNSGVVSFGHVAFAAVGAYVAALVTIPPVIKESALAELPGFLANVEMGLVPAVALGALAAIVVAATVGGALARMSELGMAMGTLALLVLVHAVLANWDSVTRGGYGIFGIPSNTSLPIATGALVLGTLVALGYKASNGGLRLMSAREDPLASRAIGVSVAGVRFRSWVLSAGVMGAGGALMAQHLLAFDPDQFFFTLTFTTLSMLVIGGRESVSGALAGTALIVVVSDLLRTFERGFSLGGLRVPELPGLVQIAVAILIILVLVFRPAGLFGRWELGELPGRRRRFRSVSGREEAPGRPPATGPRIPRAAPSDDAPLLLVEGLAMDFAGLRALDGVGLGIHEHEILGLIGPNGSGKTTLLNVVSGVYRPTAGRVMLAGTDVTGLPPHRVSRLGLARTFQAIRLFGGLTVRENLESAAPADVGDARIDRLLRLFELTGDEATVTGSLPYGAQRRVEAARAAVRRPRVLLLDEPAAGMNEAESEQLLGIIATVRDEIGCAVIVIDHDLRLILRLSDRVHVLNEGKTIAQGSPEAVSRDPSVIEAYMGTARPAV